MGQISTHMGQISPVTMLIEGHIWDRLGHIWDRLVHIWDRLAPLPC